MKIAPVRKAIRAVQFAEQKIVHTGQHYDVSISGVFGDWIRSLARRQVELRGRAGSRTVVGNAAPAVPPTASSLRALPRPLGRRARDGRAGEGGVESQARY